MAGTEAAAPEKAPRPGVFGPRRKRRRAGVRIDMTPMVDVAFLLLIFFMVTTVFRRPLAMEVNMPKPGATVEVPEANVMTLYVAPDDSILMRMGKGDLTPVGWDQLTPTFEREAQANPQLIVLAKIDRTAPYSAMVDMMDALDDAHLERFSLVPMEDRDHAVVDKARGGAAPPEKKP